jgi:hypothetical protein
MISMEPGLSPPTTMRRKKKERKGWRRKKRKSALPNAIPGFVAARYVSDILTKGIYSCF